MPGVSSSSSSSVAVAGKTDIVWLYQPVGGLTNVLGGPSSGLAAAFGQARAVRVAQVILPVPHPMVVNFPPGSANYYTWSDNDGCWLQTQPYAAVASVGAPNTSPLARPSF